MTFEPGTSVTVVTADIRRNIGRTGVVVSSKLDSRGKLHYYVKMDDKGLVTPWEDYKLARICMSASCLFTLEEITGGI